MCVDACRYLITYLTACMFFSVCTKECCALAYCVCLCVQAGDDDVCVCERGRCVI